MEQQFDHIDLKLIKALSLDCSLSVTRIAKLAHVSRDVAVYRLSCLNKQNIIVKYGTVVDFAKMGLQYGRLGISLTNNSAAEHRAVAETLTASEEVAWAASVQGRYDFIITVLYKNISEFNNVVNTLRKKHGPNISDIHVSILNRLYVCGNNFCHKDALISPAKIDYSVPAIGLDEFDRKIMQQLRKNSRSRIIDNCQELKISPQTYIARKKALEAKQVIQKYWVILNRESFGLNDYHVFWTFNSHDEKEIGRFRTHILNLRETIYVSEAMGSSDFECYLCATDEKKLYTLLNSIRDHFPNLVRFVEHMLVLKEHKQF